MNLPRPFPPMISVQPMPSPVGGVVFYRPRYGATTGRVKPGAVEPCIINALGSLAADRRVENPYNYGPGIIESALVRWTEVAKTRKAIIGYQLSRGGLLTPTGREG